MEVGCLRHPGTSPIGSQLLQTVPMDGKSWQPSHEPPCTKKTGTRHTDKTVKREWKGLGGGGDRSSLLTHSTTLTVRAKNAFQSKSMLNPGTYVYSVHVVKHC